MAGDDEMTTFVTKYNKSFIWVDNDYLVNPETAVKRCACCKKLWYSQEYAEHDAFDDHKVPVCANCARSRKLKKRVNSILDQHPFLKECKKCGVEKKLGEFIAKKGDWYSLDSNCLSCRTNPIYNK